MDIELSPAQQSLATELRAYFRDLMSTEEREALLTDRHGEAYRALVRRMGSDGRLGVGWPKEYGGHGFGPVEQQIFVNEASRADVPLPYVTLQTVGPTLQAYGTQAQKDFFLPKILAGEIHFAIGYTEPSAGTDLASLTTSAVRDGDTYVVNGQKIFTTGAHDADYVWLACRTDTEAPRHKGISILIVDTRDPGFTWTPIITCDGAHHVNATYYSDVRVNELLNWQVTAAGADVSIADASATKVFSSDRTQWLGRALEEVVGVHGDPADPETGELLRWLDVQAKRNLVLTFGGGVNEVQRELIATAGLSLPRVPR